MTLDIRHRNGDLKLIYDVRSAEYDAKTYKLYAYEKRHGIGDKVVYLNVESVFVSEMKKGEEFQAFHFNK